MSAVTRTVKVTDEVVEDILDAAGYGIGYWATSARVDEDAKTYTFQCEEHPTDEAEPPVVLTFDEVRGAFWKLADPSQKLVGKWLNEYAVAAVRDGYDGVIEAGHVDSDLADAIIQVAAFGEIVYG